MAIVNVEPGKRKPKFITEKDSRLDTGQFENFEAAQNSILHVLGGGPQPAAPIPPADLISRIVTPTVSEVTIREAIWYLVSRQRIQFTNDFQLKLTEPTLGD